MRALRCQHPPSLRLERATSKTSADEVGAVPLPASKSRDPIMSHKRPRMAGLALLSCLTIAALCGSASAQTAPFDALDNIEGDFVNLNAPPVRPMAMTAD